MRNQARTAVLRASGVASHRVPWLGGVLACVLIAATQPWGAAQAQAQTDVQVTGLTVVQRDGFATLRWNVVDGATDYQIERTAVNADDESTGPSEIRGLWRPNRQVTPQSPAFADAGFRLGDRFRWRVRARFGTEPQPFSEPVSSTTLPSFGPQEFLTAFETSDAVYTPYEAEIEWTRRIDAASDRVRVVTIGHTAQGREINLFIIGYPAPPSTAEEISTSPTVGANCNVHGNEPTGREACFMMIRKLAFSNEPWAIDILSHATVLIVPSINGDGRAANTRGNSTGQDLNRDHALLSQPETFAFAKFVRDYTPEVMVDGHHFGNSGTCDLPLLQPRHLNTAPSIHNESKQGLVEGWFYDHSVEGWWPCPYPAAPIPGASSFTRVNGLKNMVVTLVEGRSPAGPTRPGEAGGENRRRLAYSHLWSIQQAFDYHRANLPRIQEAIADGIAFQSSDVSPIALDGDWPLAPFPAPHPGDSPPDTRPPGPGQLLDPPPCGYLVTEQQYTTPLDDGGLPGNLRTSLQHRLDAHGMQVVPRGPDTHFVPLAQPLRGLVNIVLDPEQPPRPIVAAERVSSCYPMSGFSPPVADPPVVNTASAGSSRPITFSLGGDRGIEILYGGSPASRPIDCATLDPIGPVEAAKAAGGSGLQYDAADDEYTYVWKTSRDWAGTCREFALGLDDGTSYPAYFRFT
jgi:hypothetical protein